MAPAVSTSAETWFVNCKFERNVVRASLQMFTVHRLCRSPDAALCSGCARCTLHTAGETLLCCPLACLQVGNNGGAVLLEGGCPAGYFIRYWFKVGRPCFK